jgi:hypothetical protein
MQGPWYKTNKVNPNKIKICCQLYVLEKTITFKAGIMKIKAGHSKSNRMNRELLSAYALMEAHFILLDNVLENK